MTWTPKNLKDSEKKQETLHYGSIFSATTVSSRLPPGREALMHACDSELFPMTDASDASQGSCTAANGWTCRAARLQACSIPGHCGVEYHKPLKHYWQQKSCTKGTHGGVRCTPLQDLVGQSTEGTAASLNVDPSCNICGLFSLSLRFWRV
jgi:hypothetical protein